MRSEQRKQTDIEWLRADYESLTSACNYLLLAHGASLATYFTTFKELRELPEFRGSGIIVTILAVGLAAAAIGFALVNWARSGALLAAHSNKGLGGDELTGWDYASIVVLFFSLICFVIVLIIVALRFYKV